MSRTLPISSSSTLALSSSALDAPDIYALLIEMQKVASKGRQLFHELVRSESKNLYQQQLQGAGYLRSSAKWTLGTTLLSVVAGTSHAITAARGEFAQGLANKVHELVPRLLQGGNPQERLDRFAQFYQPFANTLSSLSDGTQKNFESLYQSRRSGSDAEAERTRQSHQLYLEGERSNQEAAKRALDDALRLQEGELAAKKAIVAR